MRVGVWLIIQSHMDHECADGAYRGLKSSFPLGIPSTGRCPSFHGTILISERIEAGVLTPSHTAGAAVSKRRLWTDALDLLSRNCTSLKCSCLDRICQPTGHSVICLVGRSDLQKE